MITGATSSPGRMALKPVASPKRRLFKFPLEVLSDVYKIRNEIKELNLKLTFASGLMFGVLLEADRGVLFLCDRGVARLARLAGVALKLMPSLDVWLLVPCPGIGIDTLGVFNSGSKFVGCTFIRRLKTEC